MNATATGPRDLAEGNFNIARALPRLSGMQLPCAKDASGWQLLRQGSSGRALATVQSSGRQGRASILQQRLSAVGSHGDAQLHLHRLLQEVQSAAAPAKSARFADAAAAAVAAAAAPATGKITAATPAHKRSALDRAATHGARSIARTATLQPNLQVEGQAGLTGLASTASNLLEVVHVACPACAGSALD
jgi:hypothetical protein